MAPVDEQLSLGKDPHRRVVRASAADVEYHWRYIRAGLLKVLSKQDRHVSWHPEHVKQQVQANQAEMYFVVQPDDVSPNLVLNGFFVLSMMNDPFLHMPVGLFVWIAYANGPAFDDGLAAIDHMAFERGVRFIECITPRPGLVRKLTHRGWRVSDYILRKDMYDGSE